MTTFPTDHHIAAIRIAREVTPSLGVAIPEDLWDEFALDLGDENAAFNLHQQLNFHRRLLEVMDDPLLGLKLGALFPPQAYGMFGLAILCAHDQRQALRFVNDYAHLAYTLQTPQFRETEGGGILEFTDPGFNLDPPLKAFFADRDLAAAVYATKDAVLGPAQLTRVTIAHGDHGLSRHYEDFFACPVAFDSPRNQIVLAGAQLDRPNPFRNAAAFEACRRECDRQMSTLAGKNDIVGQVRQELFNRPGYLQDIDSIAQSLNASARTLRRRLGAAGASFIDLQQEIRFEQAQDYLRNPRLPIADIAHILGYSEPGNFTAAFKRWSGGASPRAYRRQRLDPGTATEVGIGSPPT